MQNVGLFQVVFLVVAVMLEIVANILLKISDGFRRPFIGVFSIATILASFGCLSQAVTGEGAFDLPIAYALWGALGVLITTIAGWLVFKQRLNYKGFIGMGLLILGVLILKFS